jgi:hypothetical protein
MDKSLNIFIIYNWSQLYIFTIWALWIRESNRRVDSNWNYGVNNPPPSDISRMLHFSPWSTCASNYSSWKNIYIYKYVVLIFFRGCEYLIPYSVGPGKVDQCWKFEIVKLMMIGHSKLIIQICTMLKMWSYCLFEFVGHSMSITLLLVIVPSVIQLFIYIYLPRIITHTCWSWWKIRLCSIRLRRHQFHITIKQRMG